MIEVHSGRFDRPYLHHKNWFRVFRFTGFTEIWLGRRWIQVEWGR